MTADPTLAALLAEVRRIEVQSSKLVTEIMADKDVDLVAEYTDWMEDQIVEAVADALKNLQPVQLLKGEGKCTFAVNRRENTEPEAGATLATRPLISWSGSASTETVAASPGRGVASVALR